ncbi:MAG: hypothetical protein GXO87_11365 [Chlorobi bacterium]|nr:hypothetical protein [Chlorobiota bacterium]
MKKNILIFLIIFSLSACSIQKFLNQLPNLEYSLKSVDNVKMVGIPVMSKNKLSDFSFTEGLKIGQAAIEGTLPLTFEVNVAVKNKSTDAANNSGDDITIKSFPWTLYLDGRKTITGNISNPIAVPDGGKTGVIKISAGLDLMKFFKDNSFNETANFVLSTFGGGKKWGKSLILRARPVISTSFGDVEWPEEIKIVEKSY